MNKYYAVRFENKQVEVKQYFENSGDSRLGFENRKRWHYVAEYLEPFEAESLEDAKLYAECKIGRF